MLALVRFAGAAGRRGDSLVHAPLEVHKGHKPHLADKLPLGAAEKPRDAVREPADPALLHHQLQQRRPRSSFRYSGAIYVDVGGFAKVLKIINNGAVEEKFRVFKSLIDIYVLKNEEKELSSYVKTEREGVLRSEKDETIRLYLLNKQRNEKGNQ